MSTTEKKTAAPSTNAGETAADSATSKLIIKSMSKFVPLLGNVEDLDPLRLPYFEKYLPIDWKKPIPSEYSKMAKALKTITFQKKVSLSSIIDPNKNLVAQTMYNLCIRTKVHHPHIKVLLKKFNILKDNRKFIEEFTARILIGEMLWGSQVLRSNCREVQIMKYYEESLRESFLEVLDTLINPEEAQRFKLPVYIRINTLSISIDDCLSAFEKEGWNLLPRSNSYAEYLRKLSSMGKRDFMRDYHISELLVFTHGVKFYNHPGYVKKKFLYQDKGSCLSSFLLNPKPHSVILDVGAAPGLKTNHLANIMENTGKIYAVDSHPDRFAEFQEFMDQTEVKNITPINADYGDVDIPKEDVKYILIDPTSTYSGIFFVTGTQKKGQRTRLQQFSHTQSEMLRYSLLKYPNVKRVIYTVCSVYPEEGEVVVDSALQAIGDSYTLLNVKEMLWHEWESMSPPDFPQVEKCLRIIPEVDLCQGYFIAVFERNFDVPLPEFKSVVFDANKLALSAENRNQIDIFEPNRDRTIIPRQLSEPTVFKRQPIEVSTFNRQLPEPKAIPSLMSEPLIQRPLLESNLMRNEPDIALNSTNRQLQILQDRMEKAQALKISLLNKKKYTPNTLRWENPQAKNKSRQDSKRLQPSEGLLPTPTGLLPTPEINTNLVTYPNQNLMMGRPLGTQRDFFSMSSMNTQQDAFQHRDELQNVFSQSQLSDFQNKFSLFNQNQNRFMEPNEPKNFYDQPNKSLFSHSQPMDNPNMYTEMNLNNRQNVYLSSNERQNVFSMGNERMNEYSMGNERMIEYPMGNERMNEYSMGNERMNEYSQNLDMYPRAQVSEFQNPFSFPDDRPSLVSQSSMNRNQSINQQQSQFNRSSTSYSNTSNSERIYEKTHSQLWP